MRKIIYRVREKKTNKEYRAFEDKGMLGSREWFVGRETNYQPQAYSYSDFYKEFIILNVEEPDTSEGIEHIDEVVSERLRTIQRELEKCVSRLDRLVKICLWIIWAIFVSAIWVSLGRFI